MIRPRPHVVITGTYGAFKADLETGEIFARDHTSEYDHIRRVDVHELKSRFIVESGDKWNVWHVGIYDTGGGYVSPLKYSRGDPEPWERNESHIYIKGSTQIVANLYPAEEGYIQLVVDAHNRNLY